MREGQKIIRTMKQDLDVPRWKYVVLAAAGLFRNLVELLSFGYLTSDLYTEVLFSDWIDQP